MHKRFVILLLLLPPLACSVTGQWVIQSAGFADSLHSIQSIWAVDEHVAWATADYDGPGDSTFQAFTRTLDGGQQWTAGSVAGMAGYSSSMIFALNADTAYILFHHPEQDGGKLMRTGDGGQNWTPQASAEFSSAKEAYPNLVYFWDAQNGFLMGDPTDGFFEIYTTDNGGTLWTRVDSVNIPTIISGEYGYEREFTVIGNTVWFGTSKGRVFRSTDRGYQWTAINTPMLNTGRCRIVEFRDSLHGIVADRAGSLAVMYETNDGGQTWQPITPAGTAYGRYLEYIPGTDSTYISSSDAGLDQGVSISYDDGHHWMDVSPGPGTGAGVIWFPNALAGWAGQRSLPSGAGGMLKYVGNTVNLASDPAPEFRLVPNPCHTEVIVEGLAWDARAGISVTDLAGRVLPFSVTRHGPWTGITLGEEVYGLCIVRITHEKGTSGAKLVVAGNR